MEPSGDATSDPLPNGGLQILTDLITHQDTTTWTVLSVFLAAEFLLLALYVQAIPAANFIATAGTLGLFGFVTTVVSLLLVKRSEKYLKAYYDLAKKRCHAQDREIFDIQATDVPKTGLILRILHYGFLVLWVLLTAFYLLVLPSSLAHLIV